MKARREPEGFAQWDVLADSFRRGLSETSGELPPLGLATAVVARWSERRTQWEFGVFEWVSIRLAMVSSVAALAVWGAWFWNTGLAPGEEGVDLPLLEDVVW